MCGIAGFVTRKPFGGPASVLERMTNVIEHRGPDGFGYYRDEWAQLGHRRLSIIDVAAGAQPMFNETGSLCIIYNGEVFNHADVRPDLEKAGHVYQTHCDTETILHAYEEYGPACVERFRGMFAFVIWDKEKQRLFCARDRLGIKPFYYYWDGQTFVFGSEIKVLLEHPAVPVVFEESTLPEHLAFGYISGEKTMFRNIRKLMPGHRMVLDLRSSAADPHIERYWDVPAPPARFDSPDDERGWVKETRRRLEETVRMRLMSDVPLGMFLSGGVDSSAIAALIKRMTDSPVKTFSVGYEEAQYSELSYAAQTAKAIGTDHHEVTLGMEEFFNELPKLIWHEDEPIAWPSSVSLYVVSKLAAREVKVVLTGEGADELFGGYERYGWYMFNQRGLGAYQVVPAGIREWVRGQIGTSSLLSATMRRKLGHTFLGREGSMESLYLDNFYSAFSREEQDKLRPSSDGEIYGSFRKYWDGYPASASQLQHMLYADQKTYLTELLMKQDQMSMATSIESRVPFLDHTFVEFAATVPDHFKIRSGTQKYILKKAVEDLVPKDVIYRKKMGFPTPLRQWLREPRAEPLFAALTDRDGFLASYVDREQVARLLERQRSGAEDCTDRIWRLLNLQLWGDLFITGKRSRWWDGVPRPEPAAV